MSRKDSKSMFANVLGQLGNDISQPIGHSKSSSPHLLKVAAGVRHIQERSDLADRLLKDAEHIVELDPATIEPSSIVDRYDPAYDEIAIREIAQSMRERGQIVPGLVRPIQGKDGSFQIVYGRRRLAAANQLGIKFKAAIRELTDEQAVIIQGEENTAREDLSFIEKCSFALAQEQAGFKRDVICSSLSTNKSHVSEMIKIASAIPRDTLLSIGAAPEIGRPRWIEFVEAWEHANNPKALADDVVSHRSFAELSSRDRFAAVMKALSLKGAGTANEPKRAELRSKGITLARVSYAPSGVKLNFMKNVPTEFVDYLLARIENLHEDYLSQTSRAENNEQSQEN
jgi:ParB family chromosome partitioning protein